MSRKNTFRVTFYVNSTRVYRDGTSPIMMRMSIDGNRQVSTMHQNIPMSEWDAKSGMPKRKLANTEITLYLETMRTRAFEAFMELTRQGEVIEPARVKALMFGRDPEGERKTLLGIWDEHNAELGRRVGKGVSATLHQKHRYLRNGFEDFLMLNYRVNDLALHRVSYEHIRGFQQYMLSVRGNSNNTVFRNMLLLKKIILIALNSEWMKKNPFDKFKMKLEPIDPVYLTDLELATLEQAKMPSERLEKVRDWFLFSCYTGMAYSDVKQVKRIHLVHQSGVWWIRKPRQKTGRKAQIPLLTNAMAIIKKYADIDDMHPMAHLFPMTTNQKLNAYLKEISELCGFEKPLTYHAARHTFATTVTLQHGVSIEAVSRMLGHANIGMTQHYARIVDSKLAQEMAALAMRTNRSLAS